MYKASIHCACAMDNANKVSPHTKSLTRRGQTSTYNKQDYTLKVVFGVPFVYYHLVCWQINMGRKVERQKTDKSASSGHHENVDDGSKSPGRFLLIISSSRLSG